MKSPRLDLAAHLEIASPEGKIQVSGDASSLTFSFKQWSTLYAAYRLLKRVQQTGFNLIEPGWFNTIQSSIILKGREVAIIRLLGGGPTQPSGVQIMALRPLNILSVLLRPR
ncbi:MAG: hypothetical protein VXW00_03775 [Candidatus Latescibacterota bacterium]|nr:hypothetical protein [Candidatus Latescibacterota bacterium]